MRMTHRRTALIIIILCSINISCEQKKESTIIARVGSVALTREETIDHIDTALGTTQQQLSAYVTAWVNAELIYQESQRSALQTSDKIERNVHDVRRQMVNNAYLEQYVYAESVNIDEQRLHKYYEDHVSEFLAREDMRKLHIAIFNSRERASMFTSYVLRTSNWNAALNDSSIAQSIAATMPEQYYSQQTLFPAELWRASTTLAINDISYPIKIPFGYAVIQLLVMVQQGKSAPFELVRDEIEQRIIIEARRKKYGELLGTLRQRYAVEIFTTSFSAPDTGQQYLHE